jgi:hypothetical protein
MASLLIHAALGDLTLGHFFAVNARLPARLAGRASAASQGRDQASRHTDAFGL